MSNNYLPKFDDGDEVTLVVGVGGVTAGTLVTTTGVTAADASTVVAGVAGFDAVQGAQVTVHRGSKIHRLTASGTIANGDPLCAAAGGKVRKWVTATDPVASLIGKAWSAAVDAASVDAVLPGI